MDDPINTSDLDRELDAVYTIQDLKRSLRKVHVRADKPSLRALAAKTRHSRDSLSKTAAGYMLRGPRLPKKAVMVEFLRACGVRDDALEPWRHAWERAATEEDAPARPRAAQATYQISSSATDSTQTQNLLISQPGGTPSTADETDIRELQDRNRKLTKDNEELRQQLAKSMDGSSQMSSAGDLRTGGYAIPEGPDVRFFAMENDSKRARFFYNELVNYVRNATEEVYILGRGFTEDSSPSVYTSLIEAEKEALQNGVEIVRIHAGNQVAAVAWAQGYAEMLEEFPHRFDMRADLDGTFYNDVILVDPHGNDPVVSFLFEKRKLRKRRLVDEPVAALVITNAPTLAINLAEHLDKRSKEILQLDSQDVRDLASKYTYFAWGVHMALSKMQSDVPEAHKLGKAILYGWQRHIIGMLSGPADRVTIEHTGNKQDAFDGIAYELSWLGKARMDRLEQRAYEEKAVTIEHKGQLSPAFTYVPLPKATETSQLERGSWIYLVVQGATENHMTGLLNELRDGGAPIDPIS